MTKVSIIREPDDLIAESRVSLGTPRGFDGFYIVFRGEPDAVLDLLREALKEAEKSLPTGKYDDHRGLS